MNERNKQLAVWISDLYCPKLELGGFNNLMNRLYDVYGNRFNYRPLEPSDAGKILYECLIIKTKGVGKRKSFAGWEIARIDVNTITKHFAEIAIIRPNEKVEIRKINYKTNLEINIPCNY